MLKENEFLKIDNPFTVVVSHNKIQNESNEVVPAKSPKDALGLINKNGFDIALIAGGGKLNASFLNQNLIDEVYLDVEPHIFNDGIKLFEDLNNNIELKLIDTQGIGASTIQLHYQVIK